MSIGLGPLTNRLRSKGSSQTYMAKASLVRTRQPYPFLWLGAETDSFAQPLELNGYSYT